MNGAVFFNNDRDQLGDGGQDLHIRAGLPFQILENDRGKGPAHGQIIFIRHIMRQMVLMQGNISNVRAEIRDKIRIDLQQKYSRILRVADE